MGRRVTVAMVLALVLVLAASSAPAQDSGYEAPHHGPPSPFFQTMGPADAIRYADAGIQIEHDHPVGWALAEHRRLDHALAALQPQRKGVVDAYVVAVALDSDPNFGKEAREAARVLSRRYDATGHTIVLAGSDGKQDSDLPMGSPENISAALARAAELMNPDEDVLVLYTTSHGAPLGIVYNDADQGFGIISPTRLAALIDGLGIKRRVVIISACFSGVFVPALAGPDTAILTAASSDRTSFGCQADSDWTFFGDALVNHALRKAQPLDAAGREAAALIADWEARGNLTPSQPQMQVGESAAQWLAILDKRTPRETSASVGVPAVSLLDPH
jgi:hypothetical protein